MTFVKSLQKIADNTGGFGTLADGDQFGASVAGIGDLNSDGVPDLAVGANLEDTGGNQRGAVYVLFMNASGTVASSQKIADNTGGFGTLANSDRFGISVAGIGDLNSDGIPDLAAGAQFDDTGGSQRGAIYVLFLNANGTVAQEQKIADNTGGFGTLADSDFFGRSVAGIGDLNNDGIPDLAAGALLDDTGGSNRGAIYVLLMNANGTVAQEQKIADNTGGFGSLANGDRFGRSVAGIGDLNNDGIPDLAVGALNDDTGGTNRGAVYILLMNANGTVAQEQKIADNTGGFGTLADGDQFGSSVAGTGDLNNDGIPDLAVGAPLDDTGGTDRGALYVLYANADGTIASSEKIANNTNGFGVVKS